ncbi:MORN repeat protein [compost metagenome]
MINYFICFLISLTSIPFSHAQLIPQFTKVVRKKPKTIEATVSRNDIRTKKSATVKKADTNIAPVSEHYLWTDDEGSYLGQIKDGYPHGKGISYRNYELEFDGYFNDGSFFEGTLYINGVKYAYAMFSADGKPSTGDLFFDNCVASISYQDGKIAGPGSITYENGDQFEGEFVDGNFQGQGTYKSLAFECEIKGIFNGQMYKGEITLTDGSKYIGEYISILQSTGTAKTGGYYFPNGDQYEGEFWNKMMHGNGTYTWKDGTKYTGSFDANRITETSSQPILIPFPIN